MFSGVEEEKNTIIRTFYRTLTLPAENSRRLDHHLKLFIPRERPDVIWKQNGTRGTRHELLTLEKTHKHKRRVAPTTYL